jgi:hypothetical protein
VVKEQLYCELYNSVLLNTQLRVLEELKKS